jgi:Tol biopolymer transport system component
MGSLVGPKVSRSALGAAGAALAVAALAVAIALLFSAPARASGTSAAASGAPAAGAQASATTAPFGVVVLASGDIVVVRRSANQDSLWSVDPATKSAVQLVTLPFRPARVAQAPDGRRLAYLPTTAGPKVYVFDTQTRALVSRSLAARGVKVIDSLTWLSSTKLLVAGKTTAGLAIYPFADRLYVLNALTGSSIRFRGLAGTEPSVAPTGTLLAFVRFSDGGRISSGSPLRWVVERLYRLKLTAGTTPHLIAKAKYPNDLDIRRFNDPRLSHGGSYLITSTTGSDISVSYMVRSSATGHALQTVKTALAGTEATAWSNHGNRVAFWTMPLADNTDTTRLLVYKPATDALSHTAKLSKVAVTGFAWSSNDAALAYSVRGLSSPNDVAELWTIDPTTLSLPAAIDLGEGSMPVFMP